MAPFDLAALFGTPEFYLVYVAIGFSFGLATPMRAPCLGRLPSDRRRVEPNCHSDAT